jgi:hypothetical protein
MRFSPAFPFATKAPTVTLTRAAPHSTLGLRLDGR